MLTRTLYYFSELKRNLSLSVPKLEEIQRRKLRAIITHAYENVAFYHRRFDEVGIRPGDIKSVEDLSKIPTATRSGIQASPLNDILAAGMDVAKCTQMNTSGSTGEPLSIYLDKRAADFRFALLSRTYWEDGLRPWDRMAIITYPHALRKTRGVGKYRGVARRRHVSVFDDPESQLAVIQDYRPEVIQSYPSALVILAHACREKGVTVRPRFILTGSEFLYASDRSLIQSVFDCDSVDDYGCQEIGPLAWECWEHVGYHMNVDGVVIEFLDENGEPVAPGERGQIACTSLVNYAMPFVRYLVGDQGSSMSEKCSCGRSLPLMKMMEGRKDDFLTALDGRIVSPLIVGIQWLFGGSDEIAQFRIIQESRDLLRIQYVRLKGAVDDAVLEGARRTVEGLLGVGVQVEFELVDRIERDASGKVRKVISRVPVVWKP